MSRMMVLGLTGQTGAGKTTVSDYLRQYGITIVDADQVSRKVVELGSSCLVEIALAFGCDILCADGTLNRKKLGSIVFADKQKLKKLNSIIGPHISREVKRQLAQAAAKGEKLAVFDAPTLFESGAEVICDRVVSVIAPVEKRMQRIMDRDGLSDEDALNRIHSQHDDNYYASRSWHVIVNDGDIDQLYLKTKQMIELLAKEANRSDSAQDAPQEAAEPDDQAAPQ